MNANGTANMVRTGLQLEQDQKRQAIVDEMLRLRPDTEFKQNTYTTDLVYYSVSVIKGKVKVSKDTRGIYLNADPAKLVAYGFRTELEARNSINAVMPKALQRYQEYLDAYRELTTRMGFSVGHNYDGDTHGIYNEYNYISFSLEGFHFQFEIED